MKPFATLGSEISKVRERVRRGAESLRPAKVAHDVRDQRDRLLAKLGEQTFRLIAERKLVVPKMLQESVERLAALLGVQLPHPPTRAPEPSTSEGPSRESIAAASAESAEIDEPSIGDTIEASPPPARPSPAPPPPRAAPKPQSSGKSHKKAGKRRGKR